MMHRLVAAYAGLPSVLLSREDRPYGWVENRLSRAPPITECLFGRRASHHDTDSMVASVKSHRLSFHSFVAGLVDTNRAV